MTYSKSGSAIPVASVRVRNSLSLTVTSLTSLPTSKKWLKTELFTQSYAVWQTSYCFLKRDLKLYFNFKQYVTLIAFVNNTNNNEH